MRHLAAPNCTHAVSGATAGGPTIWERIVRHKAPVVEPREAAAFPAAIADYQAKLDDPAGGGAVLFAVCRGKVRRAADAWLEQWQPAAARCCSRHPHCMQRQCTHPQHCHNIAAVQHARLAH